MAFKIESNTKIETEVYSHDGCLKTHPCDLGDWYGDEICRTVDFNEQLSKLQMPEGEYKLTIIFEKID